jgi:K+-transporting ATPase ATPase C chain
VLLTLLTVLTGGLYPAVVTVLAQTLFPFEAEGSLVRAEGRPVGSDLIGQAFGPDHPRYFWSRPSATGPAPYNAAASTGSNLGPSNPALADAVRARIAALRAAHPEQGDRPVPVDLVTTSGSGLDPHISPAAAGYQRGRIARVRGLSEAAVDALIATHVEWRTMGILGEPRVNVLRLNRALDALRPDGT